MQHLINDAPDPLIGHRVGRLTIISPADGGRYLCRCDCGNETLVLKSNLTREHTRSCGCLKREIVEAGAHTIHGGKCSRLYGIWKHIRQRCNNPRASNYHRYGGRGIRVCDKWNTFAMFRDWALSNGYDDSLSLDRIDNSGDYTPDNCRWATPTTQANNRRSNRLFTYNGKTHTIAEWSRMLGMNQVRLRYHIEHDAPADLQMLFSGKS